MTPPKISPYDVHVSDKKWRFLYPFPTPSSLFCVQIRLEVDFRVFLRICIRKSIFFKGYFPYLPTNTQIRRSLEQINTVHFLIWLVFEAIPGKFWEQNTQPNTAYRKDFHGKLVPPARSPPFSRSLSSDRGQSRTVPRLPICLKS